MEYSIAEQLLGCLSTFIFGAFSGALYSIFKFARMLLGVGADADSTVCVKRSFSQKAVLFVFDLLFSLVVAVLYSAVLFAYAYGRVRIVFLVCTVSGFCAYHFSLARLVDPMFAFFVDVIKKAVRLCLVPIKKLSALIYSVTILKIKMKITSSRDRRLVRNIIRKLNEDVRFGI